MREAAVPPWLVAGAGRSSAAAVSLLGSRGTGFIWLGARGRRWLRRSPVAASRDAALVTSVRKRRRLLEAKKKALREGRPPGRRPGPRRLQGPQGGGGERGAPAGAAPASRPGGVGVVKMTAAAAGRLRSLPAPRAEAQARGCGSAASRDADADATQPLRMRCFEQKQKQKQKAEATGARCHHAPVFLLICGAFCLFNRSSSASPRSKWSISLASYIPSSSPSSLAARCRQRGHQWGGGGTDEEHTAPERPGHEGEHLGFVQPAFGGIVEGRVATRVQQR